MTHFHDFRAIQSTQVAVAISLAGFNGLGRSVIPTFLSRIRFYLQLSLSRPKSTKKKKQCGLVEKKFKISVHGKSNPAIMLLQGA